MALIVTVLLLLQDDDPLRFSAPGAASMYLAGHQQYDGSWGEPPHLCSCRLEVLPPDARLGPGVAAQLALLEDDDVAVRDRAQRAIWNLGKAAIPFIQKASRSGPVETRSRCLELLRERHRFSGSGNVSTTALALLSWLGMGQTPHSRDVYRRIAMGPMMQRGLDWLIRNQETRTVSDPLDEVLAALTLSEAASLTRAARLEEAARVALERVGRVPSAETPFLAWKALLLKSAERSWWKGTAAPELRRIRGLLADRPEKLAHAAVYLCDSWSGAVPDAWAAIDGLCGEPLELDPATLFFGTLALFHAFGPRAFGSGWIDDEVRGEMLTTQGVRRDGCGNGAWRCAGPDETFRKTALFGMTLQVYYRYAASPSAWDAPREER